MNDPIANVVAWWRSTGAPLNPPANDEDLQVLARFLVASSRRSSLASIA
jgi:hypothetical protein